jgi:Holliday junction resolvase RusA-like endonuclease
MYKRQVVKDWEEAAGWEIKKQHAQSSLIDKDKDICVYIDWFLERNRDIDSGIKVLLDLFQKQKVYDDDMKITKLIVTKYFKYFLVDSRLPFVDITITNI